MNKLFDRVKDNAVVNAARSAILIDGAIPGYLSFLDIASEIALTDVFDVLVELTSDPTTNTLVYGANRVWIADLGVNAISLDSVAGTIGPGLGSYDGLPITLSFVLTKSALEQQIWRKPLTVEADANDYVFDFWSGKLVTYNVVSTAAHLKIDPVGGWGPMVGFQAEIIQMNTGIVTLELVNPAYGKINGDTTAISTSARWQRLLVSCPLVDYEVVVNVV